MGLELGVTLFTPALLSLAAGGSRWDAPLKMTGPQFGAYRLCSLPLQPVLKKIITSDNLFITG